MFVFIRSANAFIAMSQLIFIDRTVFIDVDELYLSM